jgi:hypothetical protein
MTEPRTPLAAATAAIRKMILSGSGREDGESNGVCMDCQTANSWCLCERMARTALDGLVDAHYEIRESR